MTQKQKQILKLANELGYKKFHTDLFINNKIDSDVWYLQLCLLQKWMRDFYKLHIEINLSLGNNWKTVYSAFHIVQLNSNKKDFDLKWIKYHSYEKCLEFGILQTLKFIKNKKCN